MHDVLLVASLIRAQRDRDRTHDVVQDNVARGRPLCGIRPALSEARLDLLHKASLRPLGFLRRVMLEGVTGIRRRAIERTVAPARQWQGSLVKAPLPPLARTRRPAFPRSRQS